MSILNHPLWPELAPYIRIEVYGRDGGPDRPRHRIEVDAPRALRGRFTAMEMPCVTCGRTIHPVRARRDGSGATFVAVTCELAVTYGCARSGAARVEYERIRQAVEGMPPSAAQPAFW